MDNTAACHLGGPGSNPGTQKVCWFSPGALVSSTMCDNIMPNSAPSTMCTEVPSAFSVIEVK